MDQWQAILQWLALGEKVVLAGADVLAQVRAVLAANGIEADTAALDAVIVDAARREEQARIDAGLPPSV